ncbi:unnamed protein product [Mesocestoides corti]|uniref:STAS domain-containing protein n=1 Tax=Mesocestoides corti TaxID=53468 RepID=A0A0R3UEB8_MESCO|nr:unnamed protein product [Mesocestoides corti]
MAAVQLPQHLATSSATGPESEQLTLEGHMDYMACTVITVKALPQFQLADSAEYLTGLCDRLDIAKLQQQSHVE